jgi:hypothetical protein
MASLRCALVVCILGHCLWIFFPGAAFGQWYAGGTLHEANGLEWQQADASNRLATAADMVATVAKGGNTTITYQTVEDVRPYAELLSGCITQATKTRAASTLPVQDIAALCVASMEWQVKE